MDMSNQKNSHSGGAGIGIIPIVVLGIICVAGGAFLAIWLPGQVLPPQASAQAQNTDSLWQILMFIGGIVFFLVEGLLVYSIFRFKAKPNDTSDGPPIHGNTTLEVIWTLIPSVIVVVLSILSFIVWNTNISPASAENIVDGRSIGLHARGARYAWTFTYTTNTPLPTESAQTTDEVVLVQDTGDDTEEAAEEPMVTFSSNELHVYIGQNVHLEMNSNDVIHSFWIPAMRVKQDLLPGRTTEIRFTPIRVEGEEYPARYRLVCTELCGGGHGQMYSWVVVHESEEAYLNAFYNPQVDTVLNPPDDPVLLGSQRIETYACSGCHALGDKDWAGNQGPSLDGLADRAADRASSAGVANGAEYIIQSLRAPQDYIVPGYAGVNMPVHDNTDDGTNTYMSEDDLIGIVAYLCTQTGTGNPTDNTCGLEFNEDDMLADVTAAEDFLESLAEPYQE